MDSVKIMEIVSELTNKDTKYKKYFANTPNINKYLKDKRLSSEDITLLIHVLVNDEIFAWLDFISSKLDVVAQDSPTFINLIGSIIEKIKNDMAQGNFIKALIKIGEAKPELAIKIYDRIVTKSRNEDVIAYAGFMLGGVGKIKKNKIVDYIISILEKKDYEVREPLRLAVAKATRIMLENETDIKDDSFYFKVLSKISEKRRSNPLKIESVNLCFQLYKFNKKECYDKLIEMILDDSDEILQFHIADRLWIFGLEDKEAEFKLIKILADKNKENVVRRLAYYLAKNNSKNKEETFNIFSEIVKKNRGFFPSELYYALEEMLKSDAEFYILKFLKWVKEEKDSYVIHSITRLIEHTVNKNKELSEKVKKVEEIIKKRFNKK